MSTDPLSEEAIAILDAEATRRIDEIQQSIDFICSSLRAQGNMTISQLLQSVRSLTMDEYCNKYRADTAYFLEEQARQRKETTLVTPGKKRRSHRDQSDTLENDKPLSKKKQPSLKQKETESTRNSTSLATSVNSTIERSIQSSKQRHDNNNHNGTITKTQRKHDLEKEDEIDFGPLFMQFLRPGQPKVTFQFDPQEELDETTAPRLKVPYEFVDQFGLEHRRRIGDQVQHIQDQLELFKQRLLESPSIRLSSSPSPSL